MRLPCLPVAAAMLCAAAPQPATVGPPVTGSSTTATTRTLHRARSSRSRGTRRQAERRRLMGRTRTDVVPRTAGPVDVTARAPESRVVGRKERGSVRLATRTWQARACTISRAAVMRGTCLGSEALRLWLWERACGVQVARCNSTRSAGRHCCCYIRAASDQGE